MTRKKVTLTCPPWAQKGDEITYLGFRYIVKRIESTRGVILGKPEPVK